MSWIASLHDDVVDDDVRVFVCVGECFVCAQEGVFLVLTFVMRGGPEGCQVDLVVTPAHWIRRSDSVSSSSVEFHPK